MAPSLSVASARDILASVNAEFSDATHHTYAYRIGAAGNLVERSFDDGEPAGTAGLPMLQILQGNNVSDAIVIGTRYFGGTRLGIGGLTRAYRDCARLSLEKAVLIEKEPINKYLLELSYEDFGSVSKIIENKEGKIITVDYGKEVIVTVSIPVRTSDAFMADFDSVCRGRGISRQH